jgi:hypothetical protein
VVTAGWDIIDNLIGLSDTVRLLSKHRELQETQPQEDIRSLAQPLGLQAFHTMYERKSHPHFPLSSNCTRDKDYLFAYLL